MFELCSHIQDVLASEACNSLLVACTTYIMHLSLVLLILLQVMHVMDQAMQHLNSGSTVEQNLEAVESNLKQALCMHFRQVTSSSSSCAA